MCQQCYCGSGLIQEGFPEEDTSKLRPDVKQESVKLVGIAFQAEGKASAEALSA